MGWAYVLEVERGLWIARQLARLHLYPARSPHHRVAVDTGAQQAVPVVGCPQGDPDIGSAHRSLDSGWQIPHPGVRIDPGRGQPARHAYSDVSSIGQGRQGRQEIPKRAVEAFRDHGLRFQGAGRARSPGLQVGSRCGEAFR